MRLASTLALAIALALALPSFATSTPNTIQPGDIMTSSVGQCTLNFVFDGVGALAGNVYIGTAAHCVSAVGQPVSSSPYDDFGTVAVMGQSTPVRYDWALILVKPAFEAYVRAAVKGHPDMPTGIATTADTLPGDPIQLSGYGLGFAWTQPTQEMRVGALTIHEPDRVQVAAPVVFGDSGGPIVHIPTGKALSLNSHLCGPGACTEVGPSFESILQQLAGRGFTVELRTV